MFGYLLDDAKKKCISHAVLPLTSHQCSVHCPGTNKRTWWPL